MPEKKLKSEEKKQAVAESPVADVFDGRHPAPSETQWAEKTLAPTLEKNPEKPIGAATGTNLDEQGNARFSTISNVPIRRLYTQADLPTDWNYEQYLGYPGQPPYTRGIHATGYRGRLWNMRMFSGFASPEETNQRKTPDAGTNGNISSANTMPHIVDAVRAYATVGEICEALRQVYGTYTEVSIT